MPKLFILTMSLLIFSLNPPLFAQPSSSLYQTEVGIPAQTEEAKEEAIKEAFQEVLTRISGNTQVQDNPLIKSHLKRAQYYVEEYSYSAPTTASSEYLLKVQFDKKDVNRLLKKAGLSIWNQVRPTILVWLVTNDLSAGGSSDIVGSDTPGEITDTIKQQSSMLGLPLMLPILDVDEINQVSVDDINKNDLSVLSLASQRYSPDGILIGKIDKLTTGEKLQSEWQLVWNNQNFRWKIPGNTQKEILHSLVNNVSKVFNQSPQVAVAHPIATQSLILKISNVSRPEDLSQVLNYFKQVQMVQQVNLREVSGDNIELVVIAKGSSDDFQQDIGDGNRLKLKMLESDNILQYEWLH